MNRRTHRGSYILQPHQNARNAETPMTQRSTATAVLLLLSAVALSCGGGAATTTVAGVSTTTAESQMDFGIKMAQQGLWSEALFRFRQAARLKPNDYRVYNNLAVAYEATGQFEEALQAYQQALQMAGDNRELRRNYARFAEFYQSFRPQSEAEQAGTGGEGRRGTGGAAHGGGAPVDELMRLPDPGSERGAF